MADHSFNFLNASLDFDPEKSAVGFMKVQSSPGLPYSRTFHWFGNVAEAAACIRDELIPISSYETFDEIELNFPETYTLLREGNIHKSMITDLNRILSKEDQIDWIGTYKELISSDDQIPSELRNEFRKNEVKILHEWYNFTPENIEKQKEMFKKIDDFKISPALNTAEIKPFLSFLETIRNW